MPTVSVDFQRLLGPIKPLHGVNNGPRTYAFHYDTTRWFEEAHIPFSRLHDTEYPYGSGHFVDIPCVFPCFDADPEDPANYDFALTDRYIAFVRAAGAEPFYRLGVSIEHAPVKYAVHPPRDYRQWARICEGIIRHYTEGWADGFQYPMLYWEIWNEPETPPGRHVMWTGSKDAYFRLYVTAANHLKRRFPHLKIGGYGSCGLSGAVEAQPDERRRYDAAYFRDFLDYITDPAHPAPLDFLSWHTYSADVDLYVRQADYVEEALRAHGLTGAESILDEWNRSLTDFIGMRGHEGAAFNAAVLCALQHTSVSKAMYYDAQPAMPYCGIFSTPDAAPTKAYYALRAFGDLYALGRQAAATIDGADAALYSCAAAGTEGCALLLVNEGPEDRAVNLVLRGLDPAQPYALDVYGIDAVHCFDKVQEQSCSGGEHTCPLTLPGHAVLYVKLTPR